MSKREPDSLDYLMAVSKEPRKPVAPEMAAIEIGHIDADIAATEKQRAYWSKDAGMQRWCQQEIERLTMRRAFLVGCL